MAFTKYTLKNGLRIIEDPMEGANSFTLMVKFKTGSRNETADIWGISHFLEHMAFKGTKSYPDALLLAKELDKLGAMYNAFTSKEHTGYYIKGSYGVLERALAIIAEMTTDAVIVEEEVTKERGTIIEELNMYDDDPRRKLYDYFEESLFEDHQLSQDIIGSKKSLNGIKSKDIIDYREKHYRAENAVVSISGKIPEDFKKMAENNFQGIKKGATDYLPKVSEKKQKININYKKTQQTHLALGFPGVSFLDENRDKALVLATLLGGNMSSRMFSEVREKRGLAYYVRTMSDNLFDCGSFVTFAGVNNEKTAEAIEVINGVYQGVVDHVSEDELLRTKEHLSGILTLIYENSEHRAGSNATAELYHAPHQTLEERLRSLNKITKDEINSLAKNLLNQQKICLALIGPYQDKTKFEKAL